jgi:integrase
MRFPKAIKAGSAVVKVYKTRHKSTAAGFVYQVAWTAKGVRMLQQFTNLAAALEEGRLRANQLASGRIDAASISKPDRDELQAAREVIGTKGQLLPAVREWRRAFDLTGGEILPAAAAWAARHRVKLDHITVADAVKRFTETKKRAGVDVTCSYNKILPALTAFAGDRRIDTLSTRELQQWMETRYPHPVSRNTARKRIVALWRWARKQSYLARDTMTEAEQVERAREPQLKIGILSIADYGRVLSLMRAKHPPYLAAAVLAGFCGLRRSELHAQKWSDVHLNRKSLQVSRAKTNTPSMRLVPLAPAAVEWLMACDRSGELVSPPWALDRIRAFCREADPAIACPPNGFRHAFISHRAAQTGNVASTSLEAGNSPAIIFRAYRQLVTKTEGKAWFAIRPTQAVGKVIKFGSVS